MATPVPYSGVTEIRPSLAPTPRPAIDTPLAAFGGAVADAASHLGQTSDRVGDELYARALAMEQLHQEANANEAAAAYTTKLGEMHADITSKVGKDAVEAYPQFIQDVNTQRSNFRQGLDSPYAQSLYDRDSRFMQARAIWSVAGHVGAQNKAYALDSLKAQRETDDNYALQNPFDDTQFKAGVEKRKANINQNALIAGWSPERTQAEQQSEISKLWSNRIFGVAKSKPFEAQKMLDDALKSGDITGLDAARAQDFVKKQQYEVGARIEGSKVNAGVDNWAGQNIVSSTQARTGIKAVEGGNYSITGPDVNGDHALGAYQVMGKNLAPWLKEAGMKPMTEQEFLASPEAQDQLFDFKFGQYMKNTGSFNEAAKLWFTGTTHPRPGAMDKLGTTVDQYLAKANAGLARGASEADLTIQARTVAQRLDPNDPLLGDYIVERTQAIHNEDIRVQKEHEFNNIQTVDSALVQGDKNGKIPTTIEELKASSSEVGIAFDAMKPSDQLKVMNVLSKNAKGDVAWNNDRLRNYQQLIGESVHDPEAFLSEDIINKDLPIANKRELIRLQGQVFKHAEADPNLTHALQVMAPTLDASGITRAADKDGYDQFTGAMRDAVQDFIAQNKRPPKDEETELMGKRLLQKQGAGWFTSGTELFRVPVPEEAANIIRSDPKWRELGIEPSDQDIERVYVRTQYQKLYGKTQAQTP